MNGSRQYLELVRSMNPEAHANSGTSYGYLLEHGQEWEASPLPEDIEQGDPKMCFVNAYNLARRNPGRLFYVEGYATAVIPTDHAWCVDRQGRVVDNTPYWEDGHDYFGVKFTLTTLNAIQRITQGYGALVHWEHWEEVRGLLIRRAQPFRRDRLSHPTRKRRAKA